MSKRRLSSNHAQDAKNGDKKTKNVKKSQTPGLEENMLNSKPNPTQTQITNFFAQNSNGNKPLKSEEDKEEQKVQNLKSDKAEKTQMVIESDSDASYYSDGQDQPVVVKPTTRSSGKNMPNVMFYLNLSQSRPQGDYIEKIHRYWRNDYKKLEIHHGFVQWLFPNFYGSAFNKDSFKLTSEEAKIFRENKEIAERLLKSYEMMLDFYGMKLADKKTGRIERAHHYEARYKATLITSLHNHLRVVRILAHLNIVGFRHYAVELVDFIEKEMYGEVGGHQKYLQQPKPISTDYTLKLKGNPLFALIKFDVFKDWRIYGRATTEVEKQLLFAGCSATSERDFDPSILFRSRQ